MSDFSHQTRWIYLIRTDRVFRLVTLITNCQFKYHMDDLSLKFNELTILNLLKLVISWKIQTIVIHFWKIIAFLPVNALKFKAALVALVLMI